MAIYADFKVGGVTHSLTLTSDLYFRLNMLAISTGKSEVDWLTKICEEKGEVSCRAVREYLDEQNVHQ